MEAKIIDFEAALRVRWLRVLEERRASGEAFGTGVFDQAPEAGGKLLIFPIQILDIEPPQTNCLTVDNMYISCALGEDIIGSS